MQHRMYLTIGALASSALTPLFHGSARADETEELRSRLEGLKARLEAVERQRSSAERVAPAQAVTGGELPGSWKLPGSETSISFSGYARADAMFTINAAHTSVSDSFVVSSIPFDGSAANRQGGDFRMHARQSRLKFDTHTPTEWGTMLTRIEGDFFGANGNQRFSNSNSFRVRHAYGQLGPVLAGLTYTTFQDQDTAFDTVDFSGPAGQESIYQAIIRHTSALSDTLSLDLAIENPEQVNVRNVGAAAATNANFQDKLPDFVAALRYKDAWGAINLSGVLRRFNYDDGAGASDSAWGGGGHAGITVKTWGKDVVAAVVNYGKGLGRYLTNVGALDYAVTCNNGRNGLAMSAGCGANIAVSSSIGTWAGLTHYWTDELRSSAYYGFGSTKIDTAKLGAAANGLTNKTRTAHVNLIWNPVERIMIGVEYMYGWRYAAHVAGFATDTDGRASRLQLGMQYDF